MVARRIAAGGQGLDLPHERRHHVDRASERVPDEVGSAGADRALVADSAKCAEIAGRHHPGEGGDTGMKSQRQVGHHDRASL